MEIVEIGGIKNNRFNRNNFVPVEDIDEEIERFKGNRIPKDLYTSIFRYDEEDVQKANIIAPLYFDLDEEINNENDYKKIQRDTILAIIYLSEKLHIETERIKIYFSGSKGFHVLINEKDLGIEKEHALDVKYRAIAGEVVRQTIYKTVDMSVYERRRLFRLPNTINAKTGLYKVLVSLEQLRKFSYEDMKNFARSAKDDYDMPPRKKSDIVKSKKSYEKLVLLSKIRDIKKRTPKTIISFEKEELLPCVQNIVNEGSNKGERNNTCVAIASSIAQSGHSEEETREIVQSWNDKNSPPMKSYEINRTVRSAVEMAENGRGYGCRFFTEAGHCIGEECKLYKK